MGTCHMLGFLVETIKTWYLGFLGSSWFFWRSGDGLTILEEREEGLKGFSWFVIFILFIIEQIIVFNFFEIKNGSFLFFYDLCMWGHAHKMLKSQLGGSSMKTKGL